VRRESPQANHERRNTHRGDASQSDDLSGVLDSPQLRLDGVVTSHDRVGPALSERLQPNPIRVGDRGQRIERSAEVSGKVVHEAAVIHAYRQARLGGQATGNEGRELAPLRNAVNMKGIGNRASRVWLMRSEPSQTGGENRRQE